MKEHNPEPSTSVWSVLWSLVLWLCTAIYNYIYATLSAMAILYVIAIFYTMALFMYAAAHGSEGLSVIFSISGAAFALLLPLYTAEIASKKGRDGWKWFLLGIIFGLIVLIIVFMMDDVSDNNNIQSLECHQPNYIKLNQQPIDFTDRYQVHTKKIIAIVVALISLMLAYIVWSG